MSEGTLTRLRTHRNAFPIAAVLALAAIPLLVSDDYVIGVWTFILLNILVVVALDLLLGYAGQLSLGHGAFVAMGAYASALLTSKAGWSGWAAIPVGMLAAALLAALIAIPTLRLRGYYLAMATLGFPILFDALVRVGSSWTGGSSGVTAIPRLTVGEFVLRDPIAYYYLVLVFVGLALVLTWRIAGSLLGLKLRAIHADETAAMARGINVVRLKVGVFSLSAAIAALSGSLYVHNVQFVAAGTFGLQYSLMLVVMLVAGGMGRIWGGVLGVIVLSWLPELLRDAATWQPVIFGGLLALIMLFSPEGLAGLVRRLSSFSPSDRHLSSGDRVAAPQAVLEVRDIKKNFGGVAAVSSLHFDVKAGQIRAIIGPNGAGKSTALALISGALTADSGSIRIAGRESVSRQAYQRARAGLSRTFQHARLISSLTVFENIVLGASASGGTQGECEGRAEAVLHELGLCEVAHRFPGEINHFERRLTEVALALAAQPTLLLLDEPGAGLSEAEIEKLASTLRAQRERGTAIVLVDHIMALVMPLADRILVLDGGVQIADGDPASVTNDKRVRAAYLGEGAANA